MFLVYSYFLGMIQFELSENLRGDKVLVVEVPDDPRLYIDM